MLTLFVLVPILVLLLLNLPWRRFPSQAPQLAVLSLAFANVIFGLALPTLQADIGLSVMNELHFGFVADELTRVFLVCIGLVTCAAALVSQKALTSASARRNFYSVLLISLAGMNGTVLLSDFFSLYVFLEVTGIASFILIAFEKNLFAVEGALRYLFLSVIATVFMLVSVGLIVLSLGDTSFSVVQAALKAPGSTHGLLRIGVLLYIVGLFIKGGLVPFHGWLPGAYSSAPSGVSVLLAGIVTKVSGIYAIVRLVRSVIGFDPSLSMVFLVVGSISIVVGAVAAMTQSDLKRVLAFSSISQVGYIVIALGAGTELGIVAATFHLFNHAIFKSLLFVDSASVEARIGTTDLGSMGGLGAKMPWTGATMGVGMLSAAGIPPFSGFWSKLLIIAALWKAEHEGFACLAVLASILTLGYFLVVQYRAFFGKPAQSVETVTESGPEFIVPALVFAFITLVIGAFFPLIENSPLSFLLLNKSLPW